MKHLQGVGSDDVSVDTGQCHEESNCCHLNSGAQVSESSSLATDAHLDDKISSPEPDINHGLEDLPSQNERMGKKQITFIMTALCLSLLPVALDMTITTTALPTMASEFKSSESGYNWMASSYLLATSACIPIWGKLSDIWGRKPILLLANLLFPLGSLVCALAANLTMFLAGRATQGIAGGCLFAMGPICVSDLFSVRERPIYIGMFGAVWTIACALGPIIGGVLAQKASWRWCFYLNLPVGVVSFTVLLFWLKVSTPKTPFIAGLRAIDWIGTVMIIGGTIMFLLGLEFGGISYPWNSPTVICLIIFAAMMMVLFAINEWKLAKYPIMPVALFFDWSNIIALGCCWAHATVYIGGFYYATLYFQTVLYASPIMGGVYVLPQIIPIAVFNGLVGYVIRKTGTCVEIIQFGMVFMTLGYGLFIDFKSYVSWPRLILYQIIAGIGASPNYQAPIIAIQSSLKPSDITTATATYIFLRQLSTSVSIVLGGVIHQNDINHQASNLAAALGSKVASIFTDSFSGLNLENVSALHPSEQSVVLEAYTHAIRRVWIFYTCVSGVGLIASLFLRKNELSQEHQITKTGLEEQERARQQRLEEMREKKVLKDKQRKLLGTRDEITYEADAAVV